MITLLHRKRYGTEIMAMIEEVSEGNISINFGSLYRILSKLTRRNFIVETPDPAPENNLQKRGGHRRKYYALTEQGRSALTAKEQLRTKLQGIKQPWKSCLDY